VALYRLLATLGVLGALTWAAPAWAIDENAAREHFEKATNAFTKGKFDDASREYLLAYRASNDPSLLFNVAQSHRLAGHYSSALQYYKMYLQNVPDASDRKVVEKQIREMEAKLSSGTPPPEPEKLHLKPPPEPPVAPPPTPEAKPQLPASLTEPAPAPQAEAASSAARIKIIAGGVTLGVGVALVATGIAFGALAQEAGDQLTADNRAGLPFDPAKQSTGKSDTIAEGVCLGIGAAAALAGAVVLGVGLTQRHGTRVAVVPSITPSGASASMSVRF
jgi:hypothetical protein